MDDFEEENTEKESFYSRGGEGREGERRAKVLQTYRQTYRQTNRPSDEAGPRGAFAPKK